ncbi:amino acid ABC transporter ATP-binding protein [Haloimpatiens sp. FM7315]|uniref:amino acid ABC transporter ATP-binding protein n=1 Tax=Haloimpatiens sp. FM7315 TaxID=3298609 RepID=UPI0035A2F299
MSIISLKGVYKNFGEVEVLKNINLDVKKGEIISIIGPSGSGKSTLLRSVIKLEKINQGSIKVHDNYIDKIEDAKGFKPSKEGISKTLKTMGMVFQNFNLFPHKTVIENIIEAPLVVGKIKKSQAYEAAENLLLKVGLLDKKDSFEKELSGGQKQRVAIARALAMNPDIMLFDEPTSALDPELVREVLTVIKDLAYESKMTMIIVTHEIPFAMEISDRIVFMDRGEIIQDSSPVEIKNTNNIRIKEFLNRVM